LGFGYYPWSYWPGPYFGYYGYPYYPNYGCDDPYGPYPCDPYGYAPYDYYPTSYGPYLGGPADPPGPTGPPRASVETQTVDPPPPREAFVADGRWHRFGESLKVAAPAGPAAGRFRSSLAPSTPVAYVGDGKWHRFGESVNVVAPANREGTNLAAAPRPSLTRASMEAYSRGGDAGGR
jgi:hypothetical protein